MLLQNVSLSIRAGEKIAIVGRSGAGKSTLARLLLGMHLPTQGTIRFDGHDMRALDLPRLRRQMGVVQQETFLFDDSIRANLSLNDTDVPLERLRSAAQLACIDDVWWRRCRTATATVWARTATCYPAASASV